MFRQKLGDRYIADAFRLARETDPGALLFYNDYGGEGGTAKADRIYVLLQELLQQGVPVDGVGLQMHISTTGRPSDAAIAANMRRLASLGLIVHISEMDVRMDNGGGSDQMRMQAQRAAYHDVVRSLRDGAPVRSDHVLGSSPTRTPGSAAIVPCCSTPAISPSPPTTE